MADELNGQPDAATEDTTTTIVEERPDAEPDEAGVANVTPGPSEDAETFPRDYVEKLRKESAGYRDKAKTGESRADELSKRLHAALVTATGRLADPSDLAYSPEHLESAEALTEAIDALTAAKPHLKSRTPRGDVGQGVRGSADARVDLLGMLRSRA
jgi:hypothetical protein